jgi:hypothetical protein
MNRYVVEGVLRDARSGKRVVWIAWNMDEAREAYEAVASSRTEAECVHWENGKTWLMLPSGGWVRFVHASCPSYRGLVADVVFIDPTAGDFIYRRDEYRSVTPLVHSTGGEIVHAH